ncbi:hypothetical protein GLOIN_2v1768888 [Rhizophagus irregularis DAOM 181602=DAOM 197198]|nr:hypothetical protein GLOIN_2v1768888 [Rhizophagus irregularis DAOM 181602=DAOM 197198]
MPMIRDPAKFYCSICTRRTKGFKTRSGLQRHETLKHISYNKLPSHIQQIFNSELSHLKSAIIKELQNENAFVGVFKDHIMRYSPCGSFYFCSFKGENAFDEIGQILDDEKWGERNYGKGQLSFVRLYIPENGDDNHKQKTKMKLSANGEMTVKWQMTGGKDKENHKFEAGSVQFHFFLDQCQI